MKNIEKYKDNIINATQSDITCCVIDLFHNGVCPRDCKDCKKAVMKWLLEEAKESVLDDSERKYLSEVIRPFKYYVTGIAKIKYESGKCKQYIKIIVNKYMPEYINLPYFEENTMYKGMKENKQYSLKELGL